MVEKQLNIGQILREHCKTIAKQEGKDFIDVAVYDGGNDSGNIELGIDPPDGVDYWEIINFLNNKLGYGSWAGDFSAYGMIQFNSKTNKFEVDGYESSYHPVDFDEF